MARHSFRLGVRHRDPINILAFHASSTLPWPVYSMLATAGGIAGAAMWPKWLRKKFRMYEQIANDPGQYSSEELKQEHGLLFHLPPPSMLGM